jgi:hypothetical protein
MPALTQKRTGIHSPTLDSIKMVEEFIEENSGEYKKTALCKELPKKMMYQTFMQIIDYLLESNNMIKYLDTTHEINKIIWQMISLSRCQMIKKWI